MPAPTTQPPGLWLEGHTGSVTSVAFAPDGHTLASAGWDGTLRLWEVADRSDPRPLGVALADPHLPGTLANGMYSVAFSSDGRTLAAGAEGTVRLWPLP